MHKSTEREAIAHHTERHAVRESSVSSGAVSRDAVAVSSREVTTERRTADTKELSARHATLRARYDSLQEKLAAMRSENAKNDKKAEREIERKGIGFYSDAAKFERTGGSAVVKTVKREGRYNETEVQAALTDLMGAMTTLQKQIEEDEEH
jgi:hypothetical protein